MGGFFSEKELIFHLNVLFYQELHSLYWLQGALQRSATFPFLRAIPKLRVCPEFSPLSDSAFLPGFECCSLCFAEIRADGAAQGRPEGRGFPGPGTDQEGASAPGVPALHVLSLKWSLSSQIGVLRLLETPH